jgi:hypothetical protein
VSERTDSIRTANECAYGPNTVGRLCALALCYPHGPAQHSGADEELPEEPLCGQDYTRVSRMLGNEHYRVPAPFDVYVRADSLAALWQQWAHWRPQHAPHCGAIVGIRM